MPVLHGASGEGDGGGRRGKAWVACRRGSLHAPGWARPSALRVPPSLPDDKSELEGSTLSVLSATSTASHLLPPQERLREKAFEYCQRLIEQSTRRESCCHAPPRGRRSLGSLFVPGGPLASRPKPGDLGIGQDLSPAHQRLAQPPVPLGWGRPLLVCSLPPCPPGASRTGCVLLTV